jgi:dTDP-4-dehydrorhamnose 3,5-epimerase
VLSESAEFLYKTTEYWHPEYEQSLAWNDPTLAINWPPIQSNNGSPSEPLLARKDAQAMTWMQYLNL